MVNSFLNCQLASQDFLLEDSVERRAVCIHKFGGSSLATSQRLLNVAKIIVKETRSEDFIVVSANGKVTDWLLAFANGEKSTLLEIKTYYHQLATKSLTEPAVFLKQFDNHIVQLTQVQLAQTVFARDEILAYGEIWSANLLVALLNQQDIPALFVDARDILRTASIDNFKDFDVSYFEQALEKILVGNFAKRIIITGYITKNIEGKTITLGRNGSDYTASLLANLSNAKKVVLWTDVKGIFNADPNIIQSAKPIGQLSFSEAQALASVGTNVLHCKTIAPLQHKQIPLTIRSSIEPEHNGTCISDFEQQLISADKKTSSNTNQIKSIAIKQNLLSLILKLAVDHHPDFILARLSNAGIFNLKIAYTVNTHKLSVLIEQTALNQTIQLLQACQIEFSSASDHQQKNNQQNESHTLVALIGKEISYQKSFLQILQKILSIQYPFKIVPSHLNDLFLISTQHPNSLEFFELIYHCATSADFCRQAALSFSGSYSLFAKKEQECNSLITSEVN